MHDTDDVQEMARRGEIRPRTEPLTHLLTLYLSTYSTYPSTRYLASYPVIQLG